MSKKKPSRGEELYEEMKKAHSPRSEKKVYSRIRKKGYSKDKRGYKTKSPRKV